MNDKLEELLKWKDDISTLLDSIDGGSYDDNEHQAFVDMYAILVGVLNDMNR